MHMVAGRSQGSVRGCGAHLPWRWCAVQERLAENLARIKDLRESAMQSAAPGEGDASTAPEA
jgi:hypothetical protein